MSAVLHLDQIDSTLVATVGGKGANLGQLRSAGFPVPNGFCVTTDAYREVVGDLLTPLFTPLARAQDSGELAALAAQARRLIEAAPVPVELERTLLECYAELGRPPVAVRSSATAEDLDFASFAGQQDTYLNVRGDACLTDAVRRCWASLWTDRAVSYRNTTGVDHASVALAVVVQEMVQSASAGVMFTANPVTGTRHQAVIDASLGLGEAVVSGAVNPDQFVVDTAAGRILHRQLGDKRVLIRSLLDGGTERLDRDASTEATLRDDQVLALAALGGQVERAFGAPQDTEWAVDDDGRLWLTQSRPITTLYPLIASAEHPGRRLFLCLTLAQGLTRPITPMGLSGFRVIGSGVATAAGFAPPSPLSGPRALATPGQRAFVDFTGVFRSQLGRKAMLAGMGVMEARTAAVLRRLGEEPNFSLVSQSPWSTLRPVARIALGARVPQRVLLATVSPARAYRAIEQLEVRLCRDLRLPADLTPDQRLDAVQRLLTDRVFWNMPTVIAYSVAGFALLALARRLLRDQLEPGELQTILRGLPHNVTTEMDLALWQLSRDIGDDAESRQAFSSTEAGRLAVAFGQGDLPEVAQRGLAAFLTRYGHRAVAEIDLGMPRWSDDPTHLLGMIANYLRHDDPALAADVQFHTGNAAAEAMAASLVARAQKRGRLGGALVRFSLRRARQLAGLRESPKNLAVLALAGIRHHLQLVGSALAADDRVEQADDIFFLDLADARHAVAGADLRGLVAQRKQAYDTELSRRHVPRVLLSDGTEPEAMGGTHAAAGALVAGALIGSAASAGTVTARARVILDPVGARLEPGEILVAPSTDPGWTPLFLTAGGLVMEMGGSNSHGAVVAREYGIPAVVGVPDATSRITSGETVTVDGAAGIVLPSEG